MHKSIYEIQAEYAAIIADLVDLDGEITPEMEMALTINKDELEKKAEAYALRIIEFKGQADLLKMEAERLLKRAASYERTAEHLKNNIDAAMKHFGVDKIKTDKVTLSFRKSESIEVPETFVSDVLQYVNIKAELNEQKIAEAVEDAQREGRELLVPDEEMLTYFTLKADFSKTKAKEALKKGKTIGEVMIIEKKNLQIK